MMLIYPIRGNKKLTATLQCMILVTLSLPLDTLFYPILVELLKISLLLCAVRGISVKESPKGGAHNNIPEIKNNITSGSFAKLNLDAYLRSTTGHASYSRLFFNAEKIKLNLIVSIKTKNGDFSLGVIATHNHL